MNKEIVAYTHTHTHTQWNVIQPFKKKERESFPFVTTQMGFEDIMINNVSQTE